MTSRNLPKFKNIFLPILFVGVTTLLGGCAVQKTEQGTAPQAVAQLEWPAPPNDPKFIYETPLRNINNIRRLSQEERFKRSVTGPSPSEKQPAYKKPIALAARSGLVYVVDSNNSTVIVFNVGRGSMFPIGAREPNTLDRPVAIAVDHEGKVYVLDATKRQVLVFDSLGLYQYTVGNPKDLVKPSGVAVSPDGQKIFIVDRGTVELGDHKVIAYSPNNAELFRIGPRGTDQGRLDTPLAAIVSSDNTLYVLDSGNFRVQAFDMNGNFKLAFGSLGNGFGQFSRPRSIATDPNGNVYVSDASFNNVQIFNPAGKLLMWLGNAGIEDVPGQFALMGAIAVDETGRLYVSDQLHPKIEVYRPTGSQIQEKQ